MYIREGYTFVDSLRRDGYLILIPILAMFVSSAWKRTKVCCLFLEMELMMILGILSLCLEKKSGYLINDHVVFQLARKKFGGAATCYY